MKISALILFSLFMAGCIRLFSPPSPPTREQRQAEFVRCFREEMRPTEAQLKTLQEQIFKNTGEVEDVANQLRKAGEKLDLALESDATNDDLMTNFKEVASLKAKLSEDHFRRMLVLRGILTAEQRRNFLVCKRKMGPAALPHE